MRPFVSKWLSGALASSGTDGGTNGRTDAVNNPAAAGGVA